MHDQMTISVIICTYNGEKYITDQLESILRQDMPVTQIIISDDHSTDRTPDIITKFASRNAGLIQVTINENNIGIVRNFEKALRLCDGDFIFFSDQDDIWEIFKVRETLAYFSCNPECDVLFSDAVLINDQQEILHSSIWEQLGFNDTIRTQQAFDIFRHLLLFRNVVTGACLAIRKQALGYLIPFPEEKYMLHDQWIGLRSASQHKLKFLPEKLIRYRIHSQQQTKSIWASNSDELNLFRESLIAENANLFPRKYLDYWIRKLSTTEVFKNLGIGSDDKIKEEIITNIRKGMIAWLSSQTFYIRKIYILKGLIKRKPWVSVLDILRL